MNLIDLYGDPNRGKQDESFSYQPSERRQSGAPLILITLRDRLLKLYPFDHISIVNCEQLTPQSRLGCDHTLQFMEGRPSREYRFFFEVSFTPALSLLNIRGKYLRNGLFVQLESRDQVQMALRAAANLNPDLAPLKMTIGATFGELLLEHSSFIDAALADLKFKRNLVNLTFRVAFIVELLFKHRHILLYYASGRKELLREALDLPILRGLQQAQQKIAAVEDTLRDVCLRSYDSNLEVNGTSRRHQIMANIEYFHQDFQNALNILAPSSYRPTQAIAKLASDEYSRIQLNELITKQEQKFDFRLSLRAEVEGGVEWERKDIGGYGIIWSGLTHFKVIDDVHLRRHPQAIHAPYQQLMARKTDRKTKDKRPKVLAEKEVMFNLGELSHPNFPTFFLDNRPSHEDSLYLLWEENASLSKFLKKQTVSLFQMLLMLEQAAKGLHFLHRHGIVHCDFKPDNLILCRRYLVRLIDFGEAYFLPGFNRRRHNKGQPGRTFPYAAPEAYSRGGEITPALDVYAFGVTMYRCFFGEYQWGVLLRQHKLDLQQRTEHEVLPWILPERFRDAGEQRVAKILACLSLKCTARDPKKRPLLPWIITILQQCRVYLSQIHYK